MPSRSWNSRRCASGHEQPLIAPQRGAEREASPTPLLDRLIDDAPMARDPPLSAAETAATCAAACAAI
jgi:hypothetical protein